MCECVTVGDARLYRGDCLELMRDLPYASVDLILCDLPYGTTACKWDVLIPLDLLWEEYRRVAKVDAAIVLTASQPFTSALAMSNFNDLRYSWIWIKTNCSGFANAKKQPLRSYEDVLIFYRKQPTYNPQGVFRLESPKNRSKKTGDFMGKTGFRDGYRQEFTGYPKNVLSIASATKTAHPTQKPVALMEYLIRTYTNPGDVVLDNCMGSGTTGVAAVQTGRRFIGMELYPKYFEVSCRRIGEAKKSLEGILVKQTEQFTFCLSPDFGCQ